MEWPALLRYRIVPAAIAAIAFSFLQEIGRAHV